MKVATRDIMMIFGLAINIFIAGASWGMINMKVDAIDRRLTRMERNEDTRRN